MDMPLIDRCFGIFPPKYGCFLIALFGLGCGGCGLAGIVLYGVVENIVLSFFNGTNKPQQETDPALKKFILMNFGITSLLLTIGSVLLFIGVTTSSRGWVSSSKLILLVMCFLLIAECIGLPVACFFLPESCLIKKLSVIGTTIFYFLQATFICTWLYFMVVAYNLELEL